MVPKSSMSLDTQRIYRELELLALGHVHESLLGDFVLLLVSLVELQAALKHGLPYGSS